MFFYEQRSLHGGWTPVLSKTKPEVSGSGRSQRQRKAAGTGLRVRCVAEVPAHLSHLTLSQIAEIFGQDGKFRNTHR